jgi:hypothetical protein
MVRTLANGPVDMRDNRVHAAVKLMGFQLAKLSDDRQLALLRYAAGKLAGSEDAEALLPFVRGNIPHWAERTKAIAAAATAPVARGAWQPPGKQPIAFYIGNKAHEQIAAHYVAANKTDTVRVNTTPISALLIELAEQGVGAPENATAQAIA